MRQLGSGHGLVVCGDAPGLDVDKKTSAECHGVLGLVWSRVVCPLNGITSTCHVQRATFALRGWSSGPVNVGIYLSKAGMCFRCLFVWCGCVCALWRPAGAAALSQLAMRQRTPRPYSICCPPPPRHCPRWYYPDMCLESMLRAMVPPNTPTPACIQQILGLGALPLAPRSHTTC
jgi:hypothetical protein